MTFSDGLQAFIAEEVTRESIDTLLEKAEAVRYGSADVTYSGNAFLVTFVADTAVLRHHHVADWPEVRVPLAEFIQRLRAWAE
ncbi:hypothetical protein N8H41_05420 [Pseudomonas vlassakiae]|jgi:hypothetical protein|uniref:hypothetical protein n=1 Tax=Pseudomonas TaxID=286 RepID=UPI000416035C|nr:MULTISPECIES: hypothetical protein [Pseudomonas]AXQ48308.1 hypothetical protein DZC31_14310 [Stenotrophomonas rhizophila]MBS3185322.1 hypothetical protein [Pseudomonas sp. PCH44]MCU0123414.1 hypothetical protein [Pseudomonas vlassakiae]PIK77521.1 hypothetical protein CQW31_15860 [Pseudomonas sp. 382]SNB80277.1 hypothetical protein SAMN02745900_03652 [Pseudomonas sp. URIL14HWK12:I8]